MGYVGGGEVNAARVAGVHVPVPEVSRPLEVVARMPIRLLTRPVHGVIRFDEDVLLAARRCRRACRWLP